MKMLRTPSSLTGPALRSRNRLSTWASRSGRYTVSPWDALPAPISTPFHTLVDQLKQLIVNLIDRLRSDSRRFLSRHD